MRGSSTRLTRAPTLRALPASTATSTSPTNRVPFPAAAGYANSGLLCQRGPTRSAYGAAVTVGRIEARGHGARVFAVWAAANVVGIALVVLADGDERLVSLGEHHGPSAGEALGALLVVAGWLTLDVVTLRRWHRTHWSARAK